MKKSYISILLAAVMALATTSCEDYFLEKPMSNDVTAAEVFSSKQNALSAISQAYSRALCMNLVVNKDRNLCMNEGTLSHISGELNGFKYNWIDAVQISMNGMSASGNNKIDGFGANYTALRYCYTVIDNIDQVPDMTEQEKENVKGEMYALIAWRYSRMLIQYGGVPVVDGIVDFGNKGIPRSSVKDVMDHIINLCDNEAYPRLADDQPADMKGRLTKAAALCIKAQTLLYCARPLFNTDKPYLSLGGGNDNLLCLGQPYNEQLWRDAAKAAQAVIDYCAQGNRYIIVNTGNPFDDYGSAVAAPDSKEVIVSWQGFNGKWFDPRVESGGANSMSYIQLKNYCKLDGTDQTWPEGDEWSDPSVYTSKIEEMEERYWASAVPGGYDAKNNPGDNAWAAKKMAYYSSYEGKNNYEQCGKVCKFWHHAGSRKWFNYPIYRLAYFYLALAEAQNELGEYSKACTALNVTRNRAGLPDINLSDKDALRKAIQREWAVEFYQENNRLFDVKHWKLDDIGNGIIGGDKLGFTFQYKDPNGGCYALKNYTGFKVAVQYKGFWSDNQYLNPFPISEVNKGYIIQNPGY